MNLIFLTVLTVIPSATAYVDCRTACRTCHEPEDASQEELLEVYCSMCQECKERRREKLKQQLQLNVARETPTANESEIIEKDQAYLRDGVADSQPQFIPEGCPTSTPCSSEEELYQVVPPQCPPIKHCKKDHKPYPLFAPPSYYPLPPLPMYPVPPPCGGYMPQPFPMASYPCRSPASAPPASPLPLTRTTIFATTISRTLASATTEMTTTASTTTTTSLPPCPMPCFPPPPPCLAPCLYPIGSALPCAHPTMPPCQASSNPKVTTAASKSKVYREDAEEALSVRNSTTKSDDYVYMYIGLPKNILMNENETEAT